jgi:hypothetical protein
MGPVLGIQNTMQKRDYEFKTDTVQLPFKSAAHKARLFLQ